MKYAVVLALAGCGRLGFDDTRSITGDGGSDSGGPSDTVRVVVAADYASPGTGPDIPPGTLIDSATVLVDRGTGTLERRLTDAQGSVTFPADGLVAYHVVYGSGNAWRVYTVATGATGTVSLGGIDPPAGGTMTIVLPNGPGSSFAANLPEDCQSIFQPYSTPSMAIPYDGPCEGRLARVIAFANNNQRYLDAGMIKFARNTQAMVTGSYAALSNQSVVLTSIPTAAQFVTVQLLVRSQLDLTPTQPDGGPLETQVTGATMIVTNPTAPGADTLRVTANIGRAGRAFISTTERIAPFSASVPASASFDASTLLPAFTSLDFDTKLNLTWASGDSSGTMIVVQLLADSFEWDAYLPPTATSLAFPVIPADIGFPRTPMVGDVRLRRIDVSGATAVGLTPAIDQTWRRWPHDAALFPASGNRMAEARFLSGLVTAPSAAGQ